MELTFVRPDNWSTEYIGVEYKINDGAYTTLIEIPDEVHDDPTWESPTEYQAALPNNVYLALATSGSTDVITLRIQGEESTGSDIVSRQVEVQLRYSVSSHGTVNISDILNNSLAYVIVGEADNAPETVFVSKNDLSTVWDAVVSSVKNYTYSKNYVDNKFANVYDKSSTYSATQINTLLTDKANKSTTYTKTEVDNLIASNNNVYTKAEVDALLANAGGDTSNFYTKAEIDEMLGDIESGSY